MATMHGDVAGESSYFYFDEVFKITSKRIFFLFLFCYAILLLQVLFYNLTWDDAYIIYRYAANFVENKGLVFNPGERVEGYTTFLWVLLIGLIGKTGVDIPFIGRTLCIMSGFGTLALTLLICREFSKKIGGAAILAVLLLAFRLDFGVHFHSGMETSFYAFMLTLTFYSYMKIFNKSPFMTGILAALLPLIHPEAILFAIGIILNELIRGSSRSLKARFRTVLEFILPVIIIVGSHLIWRYSYYHDILPNTFYVKSHGFDVMLYLRGTYHLLKLFIYGGGFIYYIPAVFFFYSHFGNKYVRSMIIIICLYFLFSIYTSGDWFPYSRFMIPVLPLIIIAEAYGLVKLLSILRAKKIVSLMVIAVVIASGYQNGLMIRMEPATEVFGHKTDVNRWITLGKHFRQMKDDYPNLTIASYPVGAIGYYSEARIIDMLGLNDKHIAKNGIRLAGWAGHERSDIKYVLDREPDIIFFAGYRIIRGGKEVPRIYEFQYGQKTDTGPSRDEIYQRIWDNYEHEIISGVGEYWIKKTLIPDENSDRGKPIMDR